MQEIFGDFVEQDADQEHLIVHFSPTLLPLQQRWRNTGLSADFLAEYWTTFFPADDVPSQERQREIKGAIHYVANEMLENVMKFNYKPASHAVRLELYLHPDKFRFYTSNTIDPQTIKGFQARIRRLLTQDTHALYHQQIETNVMSENAGDSHLGLLTMINDYNARLAWKFETHPQNQVTLVITMVQLSIRTIGDQYGRSTEEVSYGNPR